jgi:hypothetical protein
MEKAQSDYARLYAMLKAGAIPALDQMGVHGRTREEILEIIRWLPHPSVASALDIADVCRQCTSGKLEYLYRFFGRQAREILDELPEETRRMPEVFPQPPTPSEERGTRDAVEMLDWTNRSIYRLSLMTRQIATAVDIVMKAQCPSCSNDMVTVIVGSELRLRCRGQTKPECRKVDWLIGSVSPQTPP